MSAWKKPSRIACRRKDWISVRRERRRGRGRRPRAPARSFSRMPSIHSVVSTSRAVRSHSGLGTRKSASSLVFSASSETAAASSRRSISIATERASVSTTSAGRRRLASGHEALEQPRGGAHGLEVAGEALAHAGPHDLDGDESPRPPAVADARLVHLGDRGGGDRLAEARRTDVVDAGARAPPRPSATASARGNGGMRSCSRSRSRAAATPTMSGRVARNWPNLT